MTEEIKPNITYAKVILCFANRMMPLYLLSFEYDCDRFCCPVMKKLITKEVIPHERQ